MKYIYSFVVWPDETWNHPRALFDYFRVFQGRTEMHFTPEKFERFRSEMGHAGFTIRECMRRPLVEWEVV